MSVRIELLVVLCMLVAGCESGVHGVVALPPPSPVVACTIISSADVASAFHRQFQPGTRLSAMGEVDNECTYIGGGGIGDGLVGIEIVSGAMAPDFYANSYQKFKGAATVSGVGTQASLASDGTAILAIKGKTAVFITAPLTGETAAELGSGCVLLAKLVFSRT
jgi:hypothetical protein